MFTVTVGLDESGKSRTCRPFDRRYSVMPSTSVTFVTVVARRGAGSTLGGRAGVTVPVRGGEACCAQESVAARQSAANERERIMAGECCEDWGLSQVPRMTFVTAGCRGFR